MPKKTNKRGQKVRKKKVLTPKIGAASTSSRKPDKLDEQDRKRIKSAANHTKAKYSLEELEAKLEECLDTLNYELALKFCERILYLDKKNVSAWETCASVWMELGETDKAEQSLKKAIELAPSTGHSKYLSLAQISTGSAALALYKEGIKIMEQSVVPSSSASSSASEVPPSAVRRDLCAAYCAVAELYMTDLCDQACAEAECGVALRRALEVWPDSAEAHQTMASYCMTLGREADAKTHIQASVALWLPRVKALMEDEGGGGGEGEEERGLQHCALSYQSRIQAAQLLVEVREYEVACEVLEVLVDEDDEVVQVWYLLGWACKLWGAAHWANAMHCLEEARRVAEKVGFDDADMMSHVEELVAELKGEGVPETGVDDGSEEDEDEDEDGDEMNNMVEMCEAEICSDDERMEDEHE